MFLNFLYSIYSVYPNLETRLFRNPNFNPNNNSNRLFKLLNDFQRSFGLEEKSWIKENHYYVNHFNLNQFGSTNGCWLFLSSENEMVLCLSLDFYPKSKSDYLEFLTANLVFADLNGPRLCYDCYGRLSLRMFLSADQVDAKSLKDKIGFLLNNQTHILNALEKRCTDSRGDCIISLYSFLIFFFLVFFVVISTYIRFS